MTRGHLTELSWPRLRDVTREVYPTLSELYAELARPTPRKPVDSRIVKAAATQGEAAQALKGKGSR